MTAHVAEAEEGRGRVILRFGAWRPNEMAIRAAMLVANAFHSEVEMLFVEDSQRVDFARFPFAKEYSLRDGSAHNVSARAVRAEIHGAFKAARKHVEAVAVEYEVRLSENVVRDDPVQALVSACARRGPWNVIAIAETFGTPAPFSIDEVFDAVSDATGVIIAGPATSSPRFSGRLVTRRARKRTAGPVTLAVEDADHLQSMIRAGRYLASALETGIVVLLVAATDDELAQMDAQVRLALADSDEDIRLAHAAATFGDRSAIAEAIRRLDSEFVIAQFGGITVPRNKSLRPLLSALHCPLLLVR